MPESFFHHPHSVFASQASVPASAGDEEDGVRSSLKRVRSSRPGTIAPFRRYSSRTFSGGSAPQGINATAVTAFFGEPSTSLSE